MLLSQTSPITGVTPWETHSENAFGDSCSNRRNPNKKLLFLIGDYLVYNMVWSSKPNIFFSSTKSSSFSVVVNLDHI